MMVDFFRNILTDKKNYSFVKKQITSQSAFFEEMPQWKVVLNAR